MAAPILAYLHGGYWRALDKRDQSFIAAPFLASDLKLTRSAAARLSPAHLPAPRGRLWAVVGGDESEEFLRQNTLIRKSWGPRAVPVCETAPGRHHMNVLHDLADPRAHLHLLARELLDL